MIEFGFIMAFVGLVVYAVSIAMAIYIMEEKGRSYKIGIAFAMVPIVGHFILTFIPATDVQLLKDAKERDLISNKEFIEKTQEIKLKK